ncbi:WAT1-related protein At5g64700-like [Aristolochia californica]|uniref:WAT1-related protein At5g64700-like n=1 Tax=Aristolochia californica TaxID=171875 RepID=UPI0035E108AA
MILVQVAYGGSNILCKIALLKGMSVFVFILYRHLIAMFILGPLAYILERKHSGALSFSVLVKIFLLAALGVTVHQSLYYAGLDFTSATVATALSNVIPALTFILAILLKMEKLKIRSARGRAKLLGTVICVGGALIFTLWKGYLFKGIVRTPLIDVHVNDPSKPSHGRDDWIKGSALILTSFVAWSSWLILLAMIYEVYPARLSINSLICFFASVQSSILALVFERNTSSWKLDWNVQLLTIIYSGTVISALTYYLQTWCVSEKGPVFVALFSPLLAVIVAVFSAFAFAERLHLGSLIGGVLIVGGLYCVLWGKSRDRHGAEETVDDQIA